MFHIDEIAVLLADIYEGNLDGERLDKLEELVARADEMNISPVEQLIPDAIYDHARGILVKHRPDSPVLKQMWDDRYFSSTDNRRVPESQDDERYDQYLYSHPMLSIQTQKSWNEPGLKKFCNTLVTLGSPVLFAAYKINGHGIRVVYDNGVLVKARSRARASEGRDLTRQMVNILGQENPNLKGMGIVEIRGEVALPVDRLDEARVFNPGIKSAFTAVSSLIKPASTADENKLLEFYSYGVFYEGVENDLTSKVEEYEQLGEWGFMTPTYFTIDDPYTTEREALNTIKTVFQAAEDEFPNENLYCDGLVVQINSNRLFNSTEIEGNYRLGNVALKVGVWEQNLYSGYVQAIVWKRGKNKRTPVAIVSERVGDAKLTTANGYGMGMVENVNEIGVLTATGNRVRNVPLYEPRNILILSAYPGHVLHFRYGGEAGVVPCFSDGSLLTEEAARALLESN